MSTFTGPSLLIETSGSSSEPAGVAETGRPSTAVTRIPEDGLSVLGSTGEPRVTAALLSRKASEFEIEKPSSRIHPAPPGLGPPAADAQGTASRYRRRYESDRASAAGTSARRA